MTKFLFVWLTVALMSCGRYTLPEPSVPAVIPPAVPTTKVVVMTFGATWCPYCKQDIPEIYRKLKGTNVEFRVYVTTGANSTSPPSDETTRKYVASLGIPESVGMSDPWKWTTFKRYVGGQYAIPAAAVLLPDGTVKAYRAGASFDPSEIADFAISHSPK